MLLNKIKNNCFKLFFFISLFIASYIPGEAMSKDCLPKSSCIGTLKTPNTGVIYIPQNKKRPVRLKRAPSMGIKKSVPQKKLTAHEVQQVHIQISKINTRIQKKKKKQGKLKLRLNNLKTKHMKLKLEGKIPPQNEIVKLNNISNAIEKNKRDLARLENKRYVALSLLPSTSGTGRGPGTLPVGKTTSTNGPKVDKPCFIEVATTGSLMEKDIVTLKQFRDKRLMDSSIGKWIVKQYYNYSPPAAAVISEYESLRKLAQAFLKPVVYTVKNPSMVAIYLLVLFGIFLTLLRKYKKLMET